MDLNTKNKVFLWSLLLTLSILLSSNPVAGYNVTGTYQSTSGNDIQFSTFQGQPLVIEAIWTQCSHCRDPVHRDRMNQLRSEYASGVSFLMISVNSGDTIQDMQNFANEFGIAWQLGLDINKVVTNTFSVTGTPTSMILDSNGKLVNKWEGDPGSVQVYVDVLNSLLGQTKTVVDTAGSLINPGGNSPTSVVEKVFSNPLVQAGMVIGLLGFIYVKSVGSKPATKAVDPKVSKNKKGTKVNTK